MKEFYLKRGSKGEVYGNEVSLEQYLTYTTEKPEKSAVEYYVEHYGDYDKALETFVIDLKKLGDSLPNLVSLINLYKQPMDDMVKTFYHSMKKKYKGENIWKIINEEMKDKDLSFSELVNSKTKYYV